MSCMSKNIFRIFITVTASALILFLGGCSAGMTKSARLEAFKADILAVNSPREHFRGDPDAATVDYATVTTVNLDNNSGSLVFTGQSITDDSFSLSFNVGTSAYTDTGTFFNAGDSLMGDDWYIFHISNDDGSITIP